MEKNKNKIIPVFIPHIGCPYKCTFCNQNDITGYFGTVDITVIKEEIEKYISYFKEPKDLEIAYFGGSFTNLEFDLQSKLLKLAQDYINKGIVKYIRISTRPDSINQETLKFLKEYNVKIIEIGVQSLNEKTLKLIKRNHTVEDVYNATKLIKEDGSFQLGYQLIPGLPGDNIKSIIKYTNIIINDLKPDFVRIYPLVILKNTEIAKDFLRGKFRPFLNIDLLNITAWMKISFLANNIDVIRIGLHPSDTLLNKDNIIAGAFYPSYHSLVNTRIFNYLLKRVDLSNYIYVNEKSYEYVIGHKQLNKRTFNLDRKNIIIDNSLPWHTIRDFSGNTISIFDIVNDIKCDMILKSKI